MRITFVRAAVSIALNIESIWSTLESAKNLMRIQFLFQRSKSLLSLSTIPKWLSTRLLPMLLVFPLVISQRAAGDRMTLNSLLMFRSNLKFLLKLNLKRKRRLRRRLRLKRRSNLSSTSIHSQSLLTKTWIRFLLEEEKERTKKWSK
jgi:hypothetical protein